MTHAEGHFPAKKELKGLAQHREELVIQKDDNYNRCPGWNACKWARNWLFWICHL